MAEDTTVTTGTSGTTVTTGGTSVTTSAEDVPRSVGEYMLYKLDRTISIAGIVAVAIVALIIYAGPEGVQVATGAIAGLVGYIGGRTGK